MSNDTEDTGHEDQAAFVGLGEDRRLGHWDAAPLYLQIVDLLAHQQPRLATELAQPLCTPVWVVNAALRYLLERGDLLPTPRGYVLSASARNALAAAEHAAPSRLEAPSEARPAA